MVVTRQQVRRQIEDHQIQVKEEIQRLANITVEQTNNLKQYQQPHIVYRPNLFFMAEKLINRVLSNNVDKLPKFGGKHNENVSKWLKDITNELNLIQLMDTQKLSIIQTFLVDDARRWFINNMANMTEWSTFVTQIYKTFSSPLHQELALKQVGNRQQGLDETVLHYFNDMMELLDMIDMKMIDQYKVAYLKAGLKVSLKKEVMRKDPKTPVEFLELAQGEEKLESSLSIQMEDIQPPSADYLSIFKSHGKSNPSQQKKPWQTSNRSRCYTCNRVGHFARDCFSKNY
jgi:hypothetical protein